MPSATSNFAKKLQSQTPGLWLPRNKEIILQQVGQKVKQARAQDFPMNPNVQAFSDFVKGNTALSSLAELQSTEVPADYHNGNDPVGDPQIRDFDTFILVLNRIIVTGPEFFDAEHPDAMGLIGFPINAVLNWPMGTRAGWAFWYLYEVNRQFQPILQDFEKYLTSSASKAILAAPSGWLGATAQAMIVAKANLDGKQRTFTEIFKCPDLSDTTYLGTSVTAVPGPRLTGSGAFADKDSVV
jgi:phosphatidylserine decarboxylase